MMIMMTMKCVSARQSVYMNAVHCNKRILSGTDGVWLVDRNAVFNETFQHKLVSVKRRQMCRRRPVLYTTHTLTYLLTYTHTHTHTHIYICTVSPEKNCAKFLCQNFGKFPSALIILGTKTAQKTDWCEPHFSLLYANYVVRKFTADNNSALCHNLEHLRLTR